MASAHVVLVQTSVHLIINKTMKEYEQARLWKRTLEIARKKANKLGLSIIHFIHEAVCGFDVDKYEK